MGSRPFLQNAAAGPGPDRAAAGTLDAATAAGTHVADSDRVVRHFRTPEPIEMHTAPSASRSAETAAAAAAAPVHNSAETVAAAVAAPRTLGQTATRTIPQLPTLATEWLVAVAGYPNTLGPIEQRRIRHRLPIRQKEVAAAVAVAAGSNRPEPIEQRRIPVVLVAQPTAGTVATVAVAARTPGQNEPRKIRRRRSNSAAAAAVVDLPEEALLLPEACTANSAAACRRIA